MIFSKTLFLICSMLLCFNVSILGIQLQTFEVITAADMSIRQNWWENYNKLPQESGYLVDKIKSIIEYDGWISEPEADVILKITNYYAEPLRSEIIDSVLKFRKIPTSWPSVYKVDNIYVLNKNNSFIKVIAEFKELLNEEVLGSGLMLITIDEELKIIDQDFIWLY